MEKTAPYGVAVVRLNPKSVVLAKDEAQKAIEIYQSCKQSGVWYGYPETVQEIDLPTWYYKQKELEK